MFKYLVIWNWYEDYMVEKVFTNVRKVVKYCDKINKLNKDYPLLPLSSG